MRNLNADGMLAELDRLGKTLGDLESAASLLAQRRGWSRCVDRTRASPRSSRLCNPSGPRPARCC